LFVADASCFADDEIAPVRGVTSPDLETAYLQSESAGGFFGPVETLQLLVDFPRDRGEFTRFNMNHIVEAFDEPMEMFLMYSKR